MNATNQTSMQGETVEMITCTETENFSRDAMKNALINPFIRDTGYDDYPQPEVKQATEISSNQDESELRYINELKALIIDDFDNPTPEFVKHFSKHVYPSIITTRVLARFTELTKMALQQYINEQVMDRLSMVHGNRMM